MVEAGANQLSEAQLLDCIFKGHLEVQRIIRAQHELFRERGLSKPEWTAPEPYPRDLYDRVKGETWEPLQQALHTVGKAERKAQGPEGGRRPPVAASPRTSRRSRLQVKKIVTALEEEILRDTVLRRRGRFDGRGLDEVRGISIEVGLLPRTHGSALFTRGETQALASVTLGTRRDAQIIEEYEGETLQKFMLHYNFPPFSVGEVKFLRGASRREIGHGVLARRALLPLLPSEEEFPYTVRVVSDILESNGSSSMATVCGGSLALFDAGVPVLAPVAGVAMGLIKGERRLRGAQRHRRPGGPLRRHGLQGRRHAPGRHRAADGHQDDRRRPRDHGRGAGAGAGRAAAHPRPDGARCCRSRAPRCRPSRRACTP